MEEERQEETITFTKQKPPFNMRKILAWAILAIVIIVIIILIVAIVKTAKRNKENRMQQTQTVVQEEKKKDGGVVVSVEKDNSKEEIKPKVGTDITTFLDEYQQDASSADAKYVGKEIETYGYIQQMTTSFADGQPFMSIIPINKGLYTDTRIKCLVSDTKVFENFKIGDGVVIKGKVQNLEYGFVPFENCNVKK